MSEGTINHTSQRLLEAARLIDGRGAYSRFIDNAETKLPDEPYDYCDKEKYEDELKTYFHAHTKYYAKFDHKIRKLWPFNWGYYDTIVDESIEEKFPRDQILRAFISAYTMIVSANQWRNIRKKRFIQLVAQLALFSPMLVLSPFAGGALKISVYWLLAAPFLLVPCWGALQVTTDRISDRFSSDARFLSAKIQNRLNALVQLYATALKDVHDEEFSREGGANPKWPHKSKWWAQLSLWLSLRVDYIEKFLQLEMQRLRIFILLSNLVGNATSIAGTISIAAAVCLITKPFADTGWNVFSIPSYIAFGATVVAAFFIGWATMLGRYSIQIIQLKQYIGEHDWPCFAEMHVEESIGELVRVDKENMRLEKLRGGGLGNQPADG